MRICLFTWSNVGHAPFVIERFAEALLPEAEIVVAAPEDVLQRLTTLPTEDFVLDGARQPLPPPSVALPDGAPDHAAVARQEIAQLERACRETRPDHTVVVYADPILRLLSRRQPFSAPVSIVVLFARAHYPRVYGTSLGARGRIAAAIHERRVDRWRRRHDAGTVFTSDREAVKRWSSRPGSPVCWLPDPAPSVKLEPREREGLMLLGSMDQRKGLDLMARAVDGDARGVRVVLAGHVPDFYAEEFASHVVALQRAGARVETRLGSPPYEEVLQDLASVRCAVLPYPNHVGTSMVLLEAASVGTPVIAPDKGLLGHLVRTHGLGLTADPTDAHALRAAILELVEDPDAGHRYDANLRRFVEEWSWETFREELRAGLGIG